MVLSSFVIMGDFSFDIPKAAPFSPHHQHILHLRLHLTVSSMFTLLIFPAARLSPVLRASSEESLFGSVTTPMPRSQSAGLTL